MKRVLVTGTSSGIGYAIAQKFLKLGYKVIGTARNPASIRISHANFKSVALELAELNQNVKTIDDFKVQVGNVDVMVLNAGEGRFGGLEEFSQAQIIAQIQVNLIAQIQLVRAFINHMKQQHQGDILFIGSESAITGGKMGTIYSAAKFGIRGFSQALRHECSANNVRVGLINPGMVASAFFDDLAFCPGNAKDNTIAVDQIADAVELIIESERNVVWDEITLSPLKKVVIKKPCSLNKDSESIE